MTLIAVIALATAYCTSLIRSAEREYSSYQTLCDLGATGDDWISFKEFVTNRPPIVQIEIPSTVRTDVAIERLPDLGNLKSLTIAFDSMTNHDLDVIRSLDVQSLEFLGAFPTDQDVDRLTRFGQLKFLYLQTGRLSADSVGRLHALLPNTKIETR